MNTTVWLFEMSFRTQSVPCQTFVYEIGNPRFECLWLSVVLQGNVRRAVQSRALESTLMSFPDHLTIS